MKYNFGILKDKNIGFVFQKDGKTLSIKGKLNKVNQTKTSLKFVLDTCIFEVTQSKFYHLSLTKKGDGYVFVESDLVSPFVGFTLYDTYGFPIELTQEILSEKNSEIDIDGFNLLITLQREKSQGSFKGETWN